MVEQQVLKLCRKCKIKKPLTDFTKDKTRPGGLALVCRQCKNEYQQKQRATVGRSDTKAGKIDTVKIKAIYIDPPLPPMEKKAPESTKYEVRILTLIHGPVESALFSEGTTKISIDDEAAGEFVVIEQQESTEQGIIKISPDEWPTLRTAINQMIASCREG